MTEIIYHFDRKFIDDRIRVDYKYTDNDIEYLIEEIPCEDFPFETKDYFSEKVKIAIDMIKHLQKQNKVPKGVVFTDIEMLLDEIPIKR